MTMLQLAASFFVMAGLVPAIHAKQLTCAFVDARDKRGHDAWRAVIALFDRHGLRHARLRLHGLCQQ